VVLSRCGAFATTGCTGSASTISHAGSALTNVALPLLVFGLTGSTLLTGLVVAVEGGCSGGASWFSRIVRMRC